MTWVMASAAVASDSLYLRLGGEPGIAAIAASVVDHAAADPVTGPAFIDVKLDRVKKLVGEHLCELAGGPCRYSGDSMKEVHAGLHISEAQFYRMVENTRRVLHDRGIDQRSINQLVGLLAPTKRDIVEHAPRPAYAPPATGVAAPTAAAKAP